MRRAPGEADLAFVETLQEIKVKGKDFLISAPVLISALRSVLPFSALAVYYSISSDI